MAVLLLMMVVVVVLVANRRSSRLITSRFHLHRVKICWRINSKDITISRMSTLPN